MRSMIIIVSEQSVAVVLVTNPWMECRAQDALAIMLLDTFGR